MLGKLFHYELKNTSRLLLLLHGFILLASLAIFGLQYATGLDSDNYFITLIQISGCIAVIGVVLFTYFYMGMRFYKTIFTDQGYLTNTLPVSAGQILLSRFLIAGLWSLVNTLWMVLTLSLIINVNLVTAFKYQIGETVGTTRFLLLLLLLIIVSYLLTIISVFCSVAIGNLFQGHKVIGSVIAYFFLQFVTQFVFIIPFLFFIKDFMHLPSEEVYSLLAFKTTFPEVFHAMKMVCTWESILSIIVCILLYGLTWRLMDKNLNLE